MPGSHPEGYVEGFANIYPGAAELMAASHAGRDPKAAACVTPTVADGARGMAFLEAAVASTATAGLRLWCARLNRLRARFARFDFEGERRWMRVSSEG